METKNFNKIHYKAVDSAVEVNENQIKLCLNTTGVIDSVNDIIMAGAFKKSIRERGPKSKTNRKIAFLYQHEAKEVLGHFTDLYEEADKLIAVAEFDDDQKSQDIKGKLLKGSLNQCSIGFNYVDGKCYWEKDYELNGVKYAEVFVCKEINLFEGSIVTFGANEHTGFVKSLEQQEDEIEDTIMQLADGDYQKELLLRTLISKYDDLHLQSRKSLKAVEKEKMQAKEIEEIKQLLLNFKF